MKELKLFWQASSKNFFYSSILLIGSYFEVTNHYSLFLQFMKVIHADSTGFAASGYFIKITAIIAALFFISCIVGFGIKRDLLLSWAMSFVTILISFSVYSKINLSWEESKIGSLHISVVLLAACLPLIVAYCTHKIGLDMQDNPQTEAEILEAEYVKKQQIKSVKAKFGDLKDDKIEKYINYLKSQLKAEKLRAANQAPQIVLDKSKTEIIDFTAKEPQRINEVVKEIGEQIVTSNQAPTETIITTQKEFDIMEMMQGQLGEKK